MEKIRAITVNLRETLLMWFLYAATTFVVSALIMEVYFVYLEAVGNTAKQYELVNAFEWKFDGTFKNSPGNIMYNADDHIFVESVVNNVKMGKMAGNRNLSFGVKNILEEYLQEKGLDLSPTATNRLKVEIVFLDVLSIKKNVSVFHKNEEEVVIRLKGNLYKDGKKGKDIIVEASSAEVSMSTLIIDEGGKFNQQSLSNAIKKACESLVNELEKQK